MKGQTRLQRTRLAVLVALATGAGSVLAASGQFTFVVGEVSVTKANGQRLVAARGLDVDAGDQIVTGAGGMAQLTMVDQARLSLRPNTQFRIESYAQRPDGEESALLSLVRGTLRTFTGLIASRNRDKFVMKTRVATVGIRGSGNILFAGSGNECASIEGAAAAAQGTDCTVNHTMEGAHAITNVVEGLAPGLPPQQGGAQTLISGPGQTVLVQGGQPPKYIPTPQFIADTAINPLGQAKGATDSGGGGETRNFGPGDNQNVPPNQQGGNMPVGNNGLGFVTIDASNNLLTDPAGLQDVVIASGGSPFLGQSTAEDLVIADGGLRGYTAYAGSQSGTQPAIEGGTLTDTHTFSAGGSIVSMGRWNGASLGIQGPGSGEPVPGAIHWIYSPSGYPTYLSEVLTGTASYTLVAATSPTNQSGTAGTLGTATLSVDFTNRTLGLSLGLSLPASGTNGGGSWQLSAANVPLSLNTFYASTADRLVITNGGGQSSSTNDALYGSVDGSLVGASLQGAILGYGITDQTSGNPSNHNVVSGVAGFTGAAQDAAAPWREGRVSDPSGSLGGLSLLQTYATTNRPDEVTQGANGALTAFVAPYGENRRAQYALGSAQVVQSGLDAETGMVWGRWGAGVATVTSNGQSTNLNVQGASLHYIFSGTQQGPVALPLTGTAVYDVIGSTSPTDSAGHVGALNSAALDANFTNRTVNASVNVGVNGQTWIGSAVNVPIYRDQYFSAVAAPSVPGASSPAPFAISCSPSCGQGATGSLDGFFAGRTGNRAGVMYNMGGVQGAVAFGRRGG